MQYNLLKYRRNEHFPSGCAINTSLIPINLLIPRLEELPMTKCILYGTFIIILIMCHLCQLTFLLKEEIRIILGKILIASPDTAKQDMENFVNTLLCSNFYQILQYFTHPTIYQQMLS